MNNQLQTPYFLIHEDKLTRLLEELKKKLYIFIILEE